MQKPKKVTLFKSISSHYYSLSDSYYYNGVQITKNDDGENIEHDEMENYVNRKIKEKILSYTDKQFDNIVLIMGAGASVSGDGYGKVMNQIAYEIKKELMEISSHISEDLLQHVSETIGYLDGCIYNKDENNNTFSDDFNLEDFISRLNTYIKVTNDIVKFSQLKAIRDKIYEIIKNETSYDYNRNDLNHGKLLNVLSNKIKKDNKITIITTNYDTLIEQAAEDNSFTVFDGFSFSQNPTFDPYMFDWKLVRDVPDINTNEHIYKEKVIDLLKIHGSLSWEKNNNKIYKKDKNIVSNPIMIFPSSNKYMQSYEEPYFDLFSRFQDKLKLPNTLLLTSGFSFADNHISRMIIQAIKNNKGLHTLISDYGVNRDKNDNFDELFGLIEDSYPIVFLKSTLNDVKNKDLSSYIGENYD